MWPLFPVKILQDISPSFSVDLISNQARPETVLTLSPEWWLAIATLITGFLAIIAVILAYQLNSSKERMTRKNAMLLTINLINDYSELLILLLHMLHTHKINNATYDNTMSLIKITCEKYDKLSMLIISETKNKLFSEIDAVFRNAQMHFLNDRLDYGHFIRQQDSTLVELKKLVKQNYHVLLKLNKQLASGINDPYFEIFNKNLKDENELGPTIK